MEYNYYIVDAFSDRPFGGNPAGVVLLQPGEAFPCDEIMRLVAAELRYSETVFVQPANPTEYTLRYFTPREEVDLCGHATIAAFSVLRHKGLAPEGSTCKNHTHAGDLSVTVGERPMMQMAEPKLIATLSQPDVVERLCRLMSVQVPRLSIAAVSTGLPDIMLPVGSLEELNSMHPDMGALADFSREQQVVGVHAFVPTLGHPDGSTAHVRNFAPLYGIDEESATGTANAALAHYLHLQGLVAKPAECLFVQGEAMQRRSVVTVRINTQGQILVGGSCRILARGKLSV